MPKLERQYQAIPEPTSDVASLLKTLQAIKQNVEVLCGMRPKVSGIADMLTDLMSASEGINARFTQYVSTSTGDQKALARRTTTLEADMYNNNGRVSTVEEASASRDSALGQRIDNVSAAVASGTANGRIAFRTNAGPTGYAASYDLILTAAATNGQEVKVGFSALAKINMDGSYSGSIIFTANSFALYDPSLGVMPVFNYGSGVFTFNVPVQVQTKDIAQRAITLPMFSRNPSLSGGATTIVVTIPDSSTTVDFAGEFDGQPGTQFPSSAAVQYLILSRAEFDGSGSVEIQRKQLSFYTSGNNQNLSVAFTYTGLLAQDTPGRAGTFNYTIITSTGSGPVALKAIVAKR